jgi:hypothetical protein
MARLKITLIGLLIAIVISATVNQQAAATSINPNFTGFAEVTFTCTNCYAYELRICGRRAYPEGPGYGCWDSGRKAQPVNNWNPRYPAYEIGTVFDPAYGLTVQFVISGNGYTWSSCDGGGRPLYLTGPHGAYIHITWSHGRALSGTCGISSSNSY